MKYRVYKYTFPNGKIYIGCTRLSIEGRIRGGYQHNDGMLEAIKQYGWNSVKKEIIADNLEKDIAYEIEKQTIASLNATDENVGYNISYGGVETFAGLKHTEAHKKHMSELYKGKVFSEETIKRLIKGHEKEAHKVIGIDADGNETEYRSICDAAKQIGCHVSTISRVSKRKGIYRGIRWILKEER